ncbi:MAG: winged helix-turn-helix domain-containing protein [Spirochaetaceae bacterium]|nr:winged helix-turn-helix domain-containing protein [Spirochaetaceae bacterium]
MSISQNAQNLNKKIVKYTKTTLRDNIILPITKKKLAIVFGVQRQSLFREIKKMSEDGIIEYNNIKILLLI